MKKKILSFALFSLFTMGTSAQVSLVNPCPQTVTSTGVLFDAPVSWRITTDKGRAKSYAVAAIDELGVPRENKAKFRVTLGVVGDKSVSKFRKLVPEKAESYYMAVGPQGVVIAGRDERGLYYGIQTLRDMMAQGKLETTTLQDWPDVAFRGAIEGFYGQPWSHEHRLRQLDFYGRNKMNVYIFGPKDDPYHRDRWREPYPEKEAKQIQELNERAKLRGVNFYWAIHPGVDIKWNEEDRVNIVNKLEKMYDLGIRSFAVFFDDIWGEGAKGENQAALLNHIDEVFVKKHGDIAPLVLCPTEYNRSWSSDNSKYLAALGNGLNKGIEVMWTGNTVVHTISKEGMEWINQRIKRKGFIWFNFPVNDFVRDHLLLGPTYGNDLNIADDLSGFVSNPMQYAESSKIALYSIADYTWNMKNYNWETSWYRAIANLLPSDSTALRIFASYNEDLGRNGHGFRRDESRHLKALCERVEKGDRTAIPELRRQCDELAMACDLLLVNTENPWLIAEMRPWLVQGKVVAQYGRLVCDVAEQGSHITASDFEFRYRQARALRKQMYENEIDAKQLHFYQTGTKLGTLRLMPALDRLFAETIKGQNDRTGSKYEAVSDYAPFTIETTVPQLALLPISMYGAEVKVAPSHEVIKWPVASQFTIRADRPITLQGMAFNFGEPKVAHKFKLECQMTDGTWKEVSLLHYKDTDTNIHTGNELGGMTVQAFRVSNISGEELQLYFRSFNFNKR